MGGDAAGVSNLFDVQSYELGCRARGHVGDGPRVSERLAALANRGGRRCVAGLLDRSLSLASANAQDSFRGIAISRWFANDDRESLNNFAV